MKVCYFGTYRKEYARNKLMIAAMERAGIEVKQCHVKLWHGIQDRVDSIEGGWKKPDFWWRVVKAYVLLIWRFKKVGDFDILMVGYPGQFDVFLAKIFAILKGKPLVWDVLMSIYLVACERGLSINNKFIINFISWIEGKSLRLPDLLIQDTQEYVNWFNKNYGISTDRFRLIPIGADDRVFYPVSKQKNDEHDKFIILYYGTFIPNHNVSVIVKAANILRNRTEICFKLIGDGPDKVFAENYVKKHELSNVSFVGWMAQEDLRNQIANADICLGVFGNTTQSLMTVHNKIIECLAMEKPIITGDSTAVRNAFSKDTVFLCNRDDPQSLADAILSIKSDPIKQQTLSKNALIIFQKSYSISRTSEIIQIYLSKLIRKS